MFAVDFHHSIFDGGSYLEFLRKHGCDEAQGYLFGAPMPAEDFVKLMLKREDGSMYRAEFAAAA